MRGVCRRGMDTERCLAVPVGYSPACRGRLAEADLDGSRDKTTLFWVQAGPGRFLLVPRRFALKEVCPCVRGCECGFVCFPGIGTTSRAERQCTPAAWFLSVVENVCFRIGIETPCRMTRTSVDKIPMQMCAHQSDGPVWRGPPMFTDRPLVQRRLHWLCLGYRRTPSTHFFLKATINKNSQGTNANWHVFSHPERPRTKGPNIPDR